MGDEATGTATPKVTLAAPDDAGMTRRADPENIYLARRAAVISILTTSGASAERAEAIVREWEARAQDAGIPRLDRLFWEGASGWTMPSAGSCRECGEDR